MFIFLEKIRLARPGAFFLCDAMERMAAETTLKAEVEDKGVANIKEDNPAWAREGKNHV